MVFTLEFRGSSTPFRSFEYNSSLPVYVTTNNFRKQYNYSGPPVDTAA